MPPDAAISGMRGFVAALLRHEGALVEAIEPEGLEILAPPPIQTALSVGEFSRLGFGATLPQAAQRVGIEGDWLDRFSRLLGARGRWTQRVLSAPFRTPGDPERLRWLADHAPLPVIEVSHFVSSIIGLMLVLVAVGLRQRLDAAWASACSRVS